MIKTLSFGAVHMTVAFTVTYIMTGSALVGGAIALVEPAVNTVAYFFHERLWDWWRTLGQQRRLLATASVVEPVTHRAN